MKKWLLVWIRTLSRKYKIRRCLSKLSEKHRVFSLNLYWSNGKVQILQEEYDQEANLYRKWVRECREYDHEYARARELREDVKKSPIRPDGPALYQAFEAAAAVYATAAVCLAVNPHRQPPRFATNSAKVELEDELARAISSRNHSAAKDQEVQEEIAALKLELQSL